MILRDGTVLQGVPITKKAWHAGQSEITCGGKTFKSLNNYAIGIDFDNVGPLKTQNGEIVDSYGSPYPYENVKVGKKKWEPYTQEQIFSYIDLVDLLCDELKFGRHNIWGHCDVSPGRKIDPGDAFPWFFCKNALGVEGATQIDLMLDLQKITCYHGKAFDGGKVTPLEHGNRKE